jgi:ATP-dependent helicase/nuclease subunit A
MKRDEATFWLPGIEWSGATAATEPADATERRRALDPHASFIVQAPAGSGKTELLIQRFLVLLSRVEQPESIVAITFTVKAAGEMRTRVLDALRKARAGVEPESAHERVSLELAAAALDHDQRAGWNLLQNPGRLRIQTIDALCMGITRQMPWLARFGAIPQVTEEARPMYRLAASAALETMGTPGETGAAAARIIRHLENNVTAAVELLARMLETRDQWLRVMRVGEDPDVLREQLERSLAHVLCHELDRLRASVPEDQAGEIVSLARYAGANLSEGEISCLSSIAALPGCSVEDLPFWTALSKLLLTSSGEWRRRPDRRVGFPPSNRAAKERFEALLLRLAAHEEFRALLESTADLPACRYDDAQWEVLTALFRLLPVTVAHLRAVFAESGQVDFIEIAEAARRALGDAEQPTDLALTMGARIEHLLVDEFQDTSVTQFELLRALTASWDDDSGRTLFLVGDPMQSIYRFRQAEVGLFLNVQRSGFGGIQVEPLCLSVNFRSARPIVEWVNRVFETAFPDQADPYTGAVPYSTSMAFREGSADAGVDVHPMVPRDDLAEAGLVAGVLERGITTAVLVRSRAHLATIATQLRDRGIRYRAIEVQALAEQPVVQDLLALTRALLHLGDRAAWLAVLRAPWCGLTLDDLHRIAAPDLKAAMWDLVRNPDLVLSEDGARRLSGILPALSAAMAERGRIPVTQLVEHAWVALQGPALVGEHERADARVFFDLIEELGQTGDVADFKLLAQRVADLFANPESAGDCALELMTIHKAKGLEFDTVVLPGLGKRARSDDPSLLLWSESAVDGGSELLMAPISRAGRDEDRTYRFIRREEDARTAHESLRLLYVACTRARRRLHLIGHVDPQPGEPPSDSLLRHIWEQVQPQFHQAVASYQDTPELVKQPRIPRVLRRVIWSGGAAPGPVEVPVTATPAAAAQPDNRDAVRAAGTLIHHVLQRIATEGFDAWPLERIASLEPLVSTPEWPLVEHALRRTLSDERGRWILSPHREAASEFAVAGFSGGEVRRLVIDRTFIDAAGSRWIIDFKTAGDEPAYREQLEAYAHMMARLDPRPIRLGLYFTATGEWIEWAP